MSIRNRLFTALTLVAASLPAVAHPGHQVGFGFWDGFIHPLTGVDHLLVLLLLGAWVTRSGGGWRSGIPLLCGLTAGILFAGGLLSIAVNEALVLLTLPVAAAAAVLGRRGALVTAVLASGLFFHGQAHMAAIGAAYTPGLVFGLALGSIAVLVVGHFAAARLRVLPVRECARS